MSDEPKLPDHQTIEEAFRGKPVDVLARLPNNTASRRSAEHLDLAYQYARESRERPDDRS
jgi:hypothetical protein